MPESSRRRRRQHSKRSAACSPARSQPVTRFVSFFLRFERRDRVAKALAWRKGILSASVNVRKRAFEKKAILFHRSRFDSRTGSPFRFLLCSLFFQRRSNPRSTAFFALLRPLSSASGRGQRAEHGARGVSGRESPRRRSEWPAIVAAAAARKRALFFFFDLSLSFFFQLLIFCSP